MAYVSVSIARRKEQPIAAFDAAFTKPVERFPTASNPYLCDIETEFPALWAAMAGERAVDETRKTAHRIKEPKRVDSFGATA